MEYKAQQPATRAAQFTPRLVIHGGAGNIVRKGFPEDKYEAYRKALLEIVSLAFVLGRYGIANRSRL